MSRPVRLAVGAAGLGAAAIVLLRVRRFEDARRSLRALGPLFVPGHPPADAPTVRRAVLAAARRVPGASGCLVRAMVAEVLLERVGLPAELHVGARREGAFHAHAWTESGGVIVAGDEVSGFAPLT